MSAQLTYHSLLTERADGSGVRLNVATPSGQVRSIPLDRGDVMRILKSAVNALEEFDLDDRRAKREATK